MAEREERVAEGLKDEMRSIIEEARMVLPGIQTLFGFQTIAVFNQRFTELAESAQTAHLVAAALCVISIALIMAPAAYHRIAERGQVSRHLIKLSSGLIGAAMLPLAASISLDVDVVFLLGSDNPALAQTVAGATCLLLFTLWFVFPWLSRKKSA